MSLRGTGSSPAPRTRGSAPSVRYRPRSHPARTSVPRTPCVTRMPPVRDISFTRARNRAAASPFTSRWSTREREARQRPDGASPVRRQPGVGATAPDGERRGVLRGTRWRRSSRRAACRGCSRGSSSPSISAGPRAPARAFAANAATSISREMASTVFASAPRTTGAYRSSADGHREGHVDRRVPARPRSRSTCARSRGISARPCPRPDEVARPRTRRGFEARSALRRPHVDRTAHGRSASRPSSSRPCGPRQPGFLKAGCGRRRPQGRARTRRRPGPPAPRQGCHPWSRPRRGPCP